VTKLIGPLTNAIPPEKKPPGDHDAGEPKPGAHFLEHQVARDLEEAVTAVKGAGAQPKEIGAEPEILVHRQRGEADIDPVEVAHEHAQDGERQQAQVDLAHRGLFGSPGHDPASVLTEFAACSRSPLGTAQRSGACIAAVLICVQIKQPL
jgi:hypothetical protein